MLPDGEKQVVKAGICLVNFSCHFDFALLYLKKMRISTEMRIYEPFDFYPGKSFKAVRGLRRSYSY